MSKLQNVLNEVSKKISLTPKEENFIKKRANQIIVQIKKNLKNEKILIGGSLAKGTLIRKEEQDVDIFVIFNDEESTKKLEKILIKSNLDIKKIHGSRDYFQLREEGIIFEFIPIVKITSNIPNRNVTDFSPLHVNYIKNKSNKKTLEEIKLTKAFCKAQNVYGAESYIQGFSGYAIELILCYYKTFTNFLKKIQKETFLDPEKKFKNQKEAFREINQSKLFSPLVLIDPTNKYRNVCAGLNKESLEKLKISAKQFLKNPSKDFFEIEEFSEEEFFEKAREKKLKVIKLELEINRDNKDIAGTKMKKFFNFLIRGLNLKEQEVVYSEFVYSQGKKSRGYLAIREKETILIKGPEKKMTSALERFKKVRKEIFFSKGFSYSREKFKLDEFIKKAGRVSKEMEVNFSYSFI